MRYSIHLVAAAVIVSGCSDAAGPPDPVAVVQPGVAANGHENSIPFERDVFNLCNDDLVHFTGWVNVRFDFTTDGAGGLHISVHANPQDVSGIGLNTGIEYRVTGATHRSESLTAGGAQSSTFRDVLNVVSRDRTENYLLHVLEHVTFDPNGFVPTVEFVVEKMACT